MLRQPVIGMAEFGTTVLLSKIFFVLKVFSY